MKAYKESFFETNDLLKCTGCRCCEQVCPVSAINMIQNNEGFLYPQIDNKKCISCNLCRKSCPIITNFDLKEPINCYAAQLRREKELMSSSSGGVFMAFAKKVIQLNGIVYGCVFNEKFEAIIKSATKIEELEKMQGSKYVSSDTLKTYSEVKKYLDLERLVLYTGTPCQISGLKAYLKKDYINLITIDFLCHGVPSKNIFKIYLSELEKKINSKITSYKFRDKEKKGWGIVASYEYESNGKRKKRYEVGELNSYFYGFINGYFNRYSCYSCPFTGNKRIADITMGDYWGVHRYHKGINLERGVSLLLVNSREAKVLLESISEQFILYKTKIVNIEKENESLCNDRKDHLPPEIRKRIYKEVNKSGYKNISKKYLKAPNYIMLKIKSKIPLYLIRMIKKYMVK